MAFVWWKPKVFCRYIDVKGVVTVSAGARQYLRQKVHRPNSAARPVKSGVEVLHTVCIDLLHETALIALFDFVTDKVIV